MRSPRTREARDRSVTSIENGGPGEGEVAAARTIDSVRQLRLDQASAVIRVAELAEAGEMSPAQSLAKLDRALNLRPRFVLS